MADLSNPNFTGYLFKQSTWLRDWRSRYFVLKNDKLYFSKSPKVPPHGEIDLRTCITVRSAEERTQKPFSFEVVTANATYYMYASCQKDKDEWIGALGQVIVRLSNVCTTENGYDEE